MYNNLTIFTPLNFLKIHSQAAVYWALYGVFVIIALSLFLLTTQTSAQTASQYEYQDNDAYYSPDHYYHVYDDYDDDASSSDYDYYSPPRESDQAPSSDNNPYDHHYNDTPPANSNSDETINYPADNDAEIYDPIFYY